VPARLRLFFHWLSHQGPVRVLLIYRDTKAGDYAAGLAFHALLTMFPIFLGLLTLIGLISRSEDLDLRVQEAIVSSFPLGMQVEVQSALLALQRSAGTYGLVAVAWLLWSGTGYFAHLEWAINRIYIAQNRSFFKQRLMGLGMICSLSTSIAAGVIGTWIFTQIHGLAFLGFFVNWFVLAVLLWSMYLVVPNRRVSLHESWPGALLASLLIQVLNLAFPIYIRLTHNFNAFGRGLLLFLVLVSWLYLVSQLLLLGAVLNRLQLGRIPNIGRSHETASPWEP
jgi:membrane protein